VPAQRPAQAYPAGKRLSIRGGVDFFLARAPSRDNFPGVVLLLPVVLAVSLTPRLKPGDPAPDFKLPGSQGQAVSLAEYKGKRSVILAFFPKAFTPG